MNQPIVERLEKFEKPPMDLLLLADPCEDFIYDYVLRGYTFIAKSNRKLVGVYVLLPTRPATIELVNIAVVEEMQCQGIGKRLVEHAVTQSKKFGYQTLELGTGNSSLYQLGLYQKCGFRIVGVDKDFFVTHYKEPIYENGIQCRDMLRLALDLK